MTLQFGFFNSVDKDRLYKAEDMTKPYEMLVSNGVFATPKETPSDYLQVIAGDGMNAIVKPGRGIFFDKWMKNDSDYTVLFDPSEVVLNRIDSVIVRVDTSEAVRNGFIMVKKGTPASEPVPPVMERSESVHEYRLADVSIPAKINTIVQTDIRDQRGSADCPWVTALIKQPDTSTILLEFQLTYDGFMAMARSNFQEFMESSDTDYHNWKDGANEEFWAWFDHLKTTVATQTLIRTFENRYTTSQQDESVIPIGITQFNDVLDILQVHINGIKLAELIDYTIESVPANQITLTRPVDAGTPIDFTVYKSVDGSEAESIVSEFFDMQDDVITLQGSVQAVEDAVSLMEESVLEVRADMEAIKNAVPLYVHERGIFPNEGVEIAPSKPLADCLHGWELVFSRFNLETTQGADSYVQSFRVPKLSHKGAAWNGETMTFPMVWTYNDGTGNVAMTVKSFTIQPDRIVGTAFNESESSRNMVLRAIYEY